jgi:hypothetical protein
VQTECRLITISQAQIKTIAIFDANSYSEISVLSKVARIASLYESITRPGNKSYTLKLFAVFLGIAGNFNAIFCQLFSPITCTQNCHDQFYFYSSWQRYRLFIVAPNSFHAVKNAFALFLKGSVSSRTYNNFQAFTVIVNAQSFPL